MAEEASEKEWQQQGDRRAEHAKTEPLLQQEEHLTPEGAKLKAEEK